PAGFAGPWCPTCPVSPGIKHGSTQNLCGPISRAGQRGTSPDCGKRNLLAHLGPPAKGRSSHCRNLGYRWSPPISRHRTVSCPTPRPTRCCCTVGQGYLTAACFGAPSTRSYGLSDRIGAHVTGGGLFCCPTSRCHHYGRYRPDHRPYRSDRPTTHSRPNHG